MKYFIDSANIDEIKKWLSLVEGVTVNPFLLVKEGITAVDFLSSIRDLSILKFVPVFSMKDYEEIKKNVGGDFICKIPMSPEYYPLIKELQRKKQTIAATTVYDMVQLNQAIELGCNYSMVYIAKNEDSNFLFDAGKTNRCDTQLVGASFRTKNDVKNAILAGMSYATVSPDVLKLAFSNNNVDNEINKMKENIGKI